MASHGVPRTSGGSWATLGKSREAELKKIQEYRSLVDNVNQKMHDKIYSSELFQLTTRLLELNPEYYTVWNDRRRLLRFFFVHDGGDNKDESSDDPGSTHIQQYITSDLSFLVPLLRKFPKCYWIWNYRLWLLSEALRLLSTTTAYQLWQKELGLVGKMLSIDSRNFHGWGYRRKVVSTMEQLSAEMSASTGGFMTEAEFEYTTRMIKNNLSNFSAWHRRSKLIPKLLDERQAGFDERCHFLDEELELLQRALWADPDSKDQSLWFYHQYLITNFSPLPLQDSIASGLTTEDKLRNVKAQIEDLLEMLDGAESCKWIYQRLIDLALMGKALDDGRWPVEFVVVEGWVEKLGKLDPLRKGRWDDLRGQLVP
ncbi:MAG: hypothetical protein Q9218_004963 [Villophora microphyllina]